MCPGAGRLTLPLSMIANKPRTPLSIPIKRALVPKLAIVIASSHDMANTKSQREANASLPKPESSSPPARERATLLFAWSSNPALPIFLIGSYMPVAETNRPSRIRRMKQKQGLESLSLIGGVRSGETGLFGQRHAVSVLSAHIGLRIRMPMTRTRALPVSCTIAAINIAKIAPRSPCRATSQ